MRRTSRRGRVVVGAATLAVLVVANGCGVASPWRSTLVTANADGTDSANSALTDVLSPPEDSYAISPDGAMVAFTTDANDLGPVDGVRPGGSSGNRDVYLRDLATGTTTLVSANAGGTTSGNGASWGPVFSPDGGSVAFTSLATDLGDDTDTNARSDIYLRSLDLGTTELVSHNAGGTDSANGSSSDPAFGGGGQWLAFTSWGSDFGPADTFVGCGVIPPQTVCPDVYVRDMHSGTFRLASVNPAGTDSGNGASTEPVFSPDGSTLVFTSNADLTGVATTHGQVFLRRLDGTPTRLVSAGPGGVVGNGQSDRPVFSPDGTKVAFESNANNLGAVDGGSVGNSFSNDVYVRDLTTDTTGLVSVNAAGEAANWESIEPAFSADGSRVAFTTRSGEMGPTDGNGTRDVYLRDLAAGTTILVTDNADGSDAANLFSWSPRFSPDGSRLAFFSSASDLGPTDTLQCDYPNQPSPRSCSDVYVWDPASGQVTLVSARADGRDGGNGDSLGPIFHPDDDAIVYLSLADNLGITDTNGAWDLYRATLEAAG